MPHCYSGSNHPQTLKHLIEHWVDPNCSKDSEAPHTLEQWPDGSGFLCKQGWKVSATGPLSSSTLSMFGQIGHKEQSIGLYSVTSQCERHHQQHQQQAQVETPVYWQTIPCIRPCDTKIIHSSPINSVQQLHPLYVYRL